MWLWLTEGMFIEFLQKKNQLSQVTEVNNASSGLTG